MKVRKRQPSLFYTYLKTVTVIVLIPFILLNIFMGMYYIHITEKNSSSVYLQSAANIKNSFSLMLETCDKIYYDILLDTDTVAYLNYDFNAPKKTYSFSNIFGKLSSLMKYSDYIESFYIYSVKSNHVLSTNSSNFLDEFSDKYWYTYIQDTKKQNFITSHRNYSGKNILLLCYELKNQDITEGYLIINIDIPLLEKYLLGTSGLKDCRIYAKNSENKPLLGDKAEISFSDFSFDASVSIKNVSDKIYCSSEITNKNLKILLEFNNEYFKTNFGIFFSNMFVWIILTLISVVVISFVGTLYIYKSISNLSEDDKPQTAVSRSLKNKIKNSVQIERALTIQLKKLKEYRTLAMQTQINPHFLFNALNSVNVYIMKQCRGNNEATEIVAKLAELLDFSLNTKTELITVREEIEYAQKYAFIENIMYDNTIEFIWNADESIKDKKTVKMILQPIIENAIRHGMRNMPDENFFIKISFIKKHSKLIVTVFNNGIPIPPEKLEEIRKKLNDEDFSGEKHIGLANVNQRIKLILGAEYGLDINSDENGTSVSVHLPLI